VRLPVSLPPRPAALAGREDLLASVHEQLTVGAVPRMVALCGMGGVGKTSLASEYAHRHLAEVGIAWQIPSEDAAVVEQSMAELAAQAGARDLVDPRDPVASVHAALAAYPAEWLLVFDNAVDETSVRRFLPPAGRGRVLITSQSQHWAGALALNVPVLGSEVAARFLVSRAGDPDQQTAAVLAGELGGLPLALEQAAAYVRAAGMSMAQYLGAFRQRRADLLDRGMPSAHPASVVGTLTLAMSRLEQDAPAAAGLLRLLAFLAPEPLPLALLLDSAEAAGGLDPEPDVASVLRDLAADRIATGDAVAALRQYSLVTSAGGGTVLVHRLVQAVIRDLLPADLAAAWRQTAADLVEAAVPDHANQPQSWAICAALLPHAQAVLDLTSHGIWQIGTAIGRSGSYAAARDLFSQIARAHEDAEGYGPEHPGTLRTRHQLASFTGRAGDPAGARDQFAALLAVRERALGPEHPSTLRTRHQLASFTGRAGDPAGARDQFAALLPIEERIMGPEHPSTVGTRHQLASFTGDAGDPAGARDQFAALLPIEERIMGPEHSDTLGTRHQLASFTGEAGDPAGARDQFAALLVVREQVLGPEHRDTRTTRRELAYWTQQGN
jgi:hypothetical protein